MSKIPFLSLCLTSCLVLGQLKALAQSQSGQTDILQARIQAMLTDKALDRGEYIALQTFPLNELSIQEREFHAHFLKFLKLYTQRTRVHYRYNLTPQRQIKLNFTFVPTYSESDRVSGDSPLEVLSHISQNDILPTSKNAHLRCGAASLLSAHYLLYGSFDQAFRTLGLESDRPLNYRTIHRAQEMLYQQVKPEDRRGMVARYKYKVNANGEIYNVRSGGDIQEAAALMNLRNDTLLGPSKARFYAREDIVKNYWQQYPNATLLVGVHLNQGSVSPPDDTHPQNHYVLVFNSANQVYLYNSGVWDNAAGSALKKLTAQELNQYVYHTRGSINALTPLP